MAAIDDQLFSRCLDEAGHVVWPGVGELVVRSARSPAKETDNEDAALLVHADGDRVVVAVADGVGGHRAGAEASRAALEALRSGLASGLEAGDSLRGAFLTALDLANRAVLEVGAGAATTLAAFTVEAGNLRAYHVGDSGVLAFGGRGRTKLETIPHSPVGYAVEAGLIGADDAMGHADRHLVSNVLGTEDMHIGVSSAVQLAPLDRVVAASDGLFDNVTPDEVVEALRSGPLEDRVERLFAECRARMTAGGHPDDLTIAAYRPARVSA